MISVYGENTESPASLIQVILPQSVLNFPADWTFVIIFDRTKHVTFSSLETNVLMSKGQKVISFTPKPFLKYDQGVDLLAFNVLVEDIDWTTLGSRDCKSSIY